MIAPRATAAAAGGRGRGGRPRAARGRVGGAGSSPGRRAGPGREGGRHETLPATAATAAAAPVRPAT